MKLKHIPVLKEQVLKLFDVNPNGIYVDLTVGYGGHASAILEKITGNGKLLAFDVDLQALKNADERLRKISNKYEIFYQNYCNFDFILKEKQITKVDGFLLDLGVSSPQLDDVTRGFSYKFDAVLDMRMDLKNPITAKDIVNNYSFHDLLRIFKLNGEKDAYQIASNIIKYRQQQEIKTTFDLVNIIKKSKKRKEKNPAKKVFQAIRIEVNHELKNLEIVLPKALSFLKKNGKLIVIAFHSLEDRLVKQKFKQLTCIIGDRIDNCEFNNHQEIKYRLLNKHLIVADEKEIKTNSRSKSARLRAIQKIICTF